MRFRSWTVLVAAVVGLATPPSQAQTTGPHFASQSQVEQIELRERYGDDLGFADATSLRSILDLGLGLLKDFEGWEPEPYDDPVGYCTVGYGHLLALKRCQLLEPLPYAAGLTVEDGAKLLEEDTRFARRAVKLLVKVDLTDAEFSAVASFVFNIGREKFASSTMLELINKGELAAASRQFGLWIKAKKKIQPGLITRRNCERLLFIGSLEPDTSGSFSRKACEALGAAPPSGDLIDIDVGE